MFHPSILRKTSKTLAINTLSVRGAPSVPPVPVEHLPVMLN